MLSGGPLRRKLLPAAGLGLGVAGLLVFVFWLQATSNAAVAAPVVRVVDTSAAGEALAPGDILTVATTLRNDGKPLPDVTVELEVHGADSQIVLRAPRRGVKLDSSRDQVVSWVWRLPSDLPAGTYTTEVSVYGPNWSPLYSRQEAGASFVVQRR
jgi:hypothetical protein